MLVSYPSISLVSHPTHITANEQPEQSLSIIHVLGSDWRSLNLEGPGITVSTFTSPYAKARRHKVDCGGENEVTAI